MKAPNAAFKASCARKRATIGRRLVSRVSVTSVDGGPGAVSSAAATRAFEGSMTDNSVCGGSSADGSAVADCPQPGTFASGGGGTYPAASGVQVLRSVPSNGTVGEAGFTAWEFRIRNGAGVPRNLRAYAVCVPVDDATGNYAPGNAVD